MCDGNKWPIWPLDGGYIITVAFNASMKYLSVHQQVCRHCTGSSNTCCLYRKLLCSCYTMSIKTRHHKMHPEVQGPSPVHCSYSYSNPICCNSLLCAHVYIRLLPITMKPVGSTENILLMVQESGIPEASNSNPAGVLLNAMKNTNCTIKM